MKSSYFVRLAVVLATVLLVGCGGGGGGGGTAPTIFVSNIQSDPGADGDIAFTEPSTFTISSALTTGSVQAGIIDPIFGPEFRGFLDFPLAGPGGVPVTASVISATLEIFIASVTVTAPNVIVPLLIDLVSFQPPTLLFDDFDRLVQPPLVSTIFDVFTSDVGTTLLVDVTPLMVEAQRLGLPDFQVRLLLDFSASTGLVEIDDSIAETAPLLSVEFF
jgi:hypothetical protein